MGFFSRLDNESRFCFVEMDKFFQKHASDTVKESDLIYRGSSWGGLTEKLLGSSTSLA